MVDDPCGHAAVEVGQTADAEAIQLLSTIRYAESDLVRLLP